MTFSFSISVQSSWWWWWRWCWWWRWADCGRRAWTSPRRSGPSWTRGVPGSETGVTGAFSLIKLTCPVIIWHHDFFFPENSSKLSVIWASFFCVLGPDWKNYLHLSARFCNSDHDVIRFCILIQPRGNCGDQHWPVLSMEVFLFPFAQHFPKWNWNISFQPPWWGEW